jgi:superfamily II DNA helicase RecQ
MNHGFESLKDEQLSAISKFISGKDVFVSLPTGFGKSEGKSLIFLAQKKVVLEPGGITACMRVVTSACNSSNRCFDFS